jgi:hypothetical protein
MKVPKRARDVNSRTAQIVAIATGQTQDTVTEDKRNPHAVALGRLGGLLGGKARARILTKSQRIKIAKKAAMARWKTKKATTLEKVR